MSDPFLDKFSSILTAATGVPRTIRSELAREADERALEARNQVGLEGENPVTHPPQDVREARCGPGWDGMGVVELVSWNYGYFDPVQAAVDFTHMDERKVGLMNTEPHRSVLLDPTFKNWGMGHYSEFPPGETNPLWERHFFVVWLSWGAPPIMGDDKFTDIADSLFRADINAGATKGYLKGYPNGDGTYRYEPNKTVTRAEMAAFLKRIDDLNRDV